MSSITFWASIAAKGLRSEDPRPSWVTENLRTRVSIGLRHIPGSPGHLPRREDSPDETEDGQ